MGFIKVKVSIVWVEKVNRNNSNRTK